MPNYSRGDVVLIRYPFSDLSSAKVRPAVVISAVNFSQDLIIVPLTSRVHDLLPGEFALSQWQKAGLTVASVAKRGLYTVHQHLCLTKAGQLSAQDSAQLNRSVRFWRSL